ncbi:flagellar export chaperone FliS [Halioxenophilus sp. WMMB6]|uniref:flagellar export chaperone FliS n=1 Tax=Halioxenophilus sp. WMMB6 TaxID=3073815 RepID=UPI00295EBF34|nr:flagellar export chaperone FliS [Halioxenophilus sp. WMMB6]
MNHNHALSAYNQVNVHTSVEDASPHKLIELLLQGFNARVAEAKVAMLNNKIELKGQKISKALDILSGLRAALDFEAGADIATNLEELYEYMSHQLVVANAQNDIDKCDEVIKLMSVIQSGWNQIREVE